MNVEALIKAICTTFAIYVLACAAWELATGESHERCGHCGCRKVNDNREFCLRCAP